MDFTESHICALCLHRQRLPKRGNPWWWSWMVFLPVSCSGIMAIQADAAPRLPPAIRTYEVLMVSAILTLLVVRLIYLRRRIECAACGVAALVRLDTPTGQRLAKRHAADAVSQVP